MDAKVEIFFIVKVEGRGEGGSGGNFEGKGKGLLLLLLLLLIWFHIQNNTYIQNVIGLIMLMDKGKYALKNKKGGFKEVYKIMIELNCVVPLLSV